MASDPKNLPRIYLDTNHWIKLARFIKRKDINPACQTLYSNLIKLRDNNKLLIPFSSNVFREIIKQNNEQRRKEMIDFLVDTSQGWFFKPVERYFKYEILNSCYQKLNDLSYYNVSRHILSNRADSVLIGSVGKIEAKNPNTSLEMTQQVQVTWDQNMKDLNVMKSMLKDNYPHIYAHEDAKSMEKLATKIEQSRQSIFKMPNTNIKKYFKLRSILELFVPDFAQILMSEKIPVEQLFKNENDLDALIENMPALNVFIKLSYARDKESRERAVQRNDYYDMCHFAIGLSYADIMVGEKMFGSISKRYKLDQKNRCKLFTSLDDMTQLFSDPI